MNEKELLLNMWGICVESLAQCANNIVDIGRMNDTLIELRKRAGELGVTPAELTKAEGQWAKK